MNNSIETYFQRYQARGRSVIMAEAPAEFGAEVAEALRYPGVVTVQVKLDLGRFKEALIAKGMPRETVGKIGASLRVLEDEAYFVTDRD